MPLFVLLFLIPATAGLVDSYSKAFAYLRPLLPLSATELSPDQRELLDQEEWGLIVASAPSETDAARLRNDFKEAYGQSGHKNANGELIWQNDILVVRDPRTVGKWLVVIDMYPGPASRESIQTGVSEMLVAEQRTGVRGDPLERWLNGSAPYRFTKTEFEATYGKIAK